MTFNEKCGYCGRYGSNDGHGGCYSCGAALEPLYEVKKSGGYEYASSFACTAVSYATTSPRWERD